VVGKDKNNMHKQTVFVQIKRERINFPHSLLGFSSNTARASIKISLQKQNKQTYIIKSTKGSGRERSEYLQAKNSHLAFVSYISIPLLSHGEVTN
jgi:hypothetical protein